MQKSALAVVIFVISQQAMSEGYDEDMHRLKAGHTPEVVDFLERVVACNHWNGEEPYDEERRLEIKKSIQELQCERLESEESLIKAKYQNAPELLTAIQKAKGMVY